MPEFMTRLTYCTRQTQFYPFVFGATECNIGQKDIPYIVNVRDDHFYKLRLLTLLPMIAQFYIVRETANMT